MEKATRRYEDLKRISENRLPQRSYYIPETGYTLLNGVWDFKFYNADYEEEYAQKEWGKIPVPSCWQMEGYEVPNYANVAYPFPCDPPYVPDVNPMGVYRRDFEVADAERKTYIVFEGVSSCLELYINDIFAGYSQGSHLQAEFDISDYVKHGNHTKTKILEFDGGLCFESSTGMEINVSMYTTKALMDAMHQDELKKSDFANVRIDYKNSGIGSASCGPDLQEKYRLSEKDISFGFVIR